MLQLATSPLSSISAWLRRPSRLAVATITVISCAALAARGASSLVASQVLPSAHAVLQTPRPPPIAAARPRPDGQLAARNMFCASCAIELARVELQLGRR